MSESFFDQHDYEIRCEWGPQGIAALRSSCDVLIIVDVLSFSTCVDIACANGAIVYPLRPDEDAARHAQSRGALLAGKRGAGSAGYSLSPASLQAIPAGTRLVLPSPNGSTLSRATGATPTIAGCLRNAAAVAAVATAIGPRIGVIPAGERWADGSLRPAIEDLIGAGAIISHLPGSRSPEAEIAFAAFESARPNLLACLTNSSSGRELIGRGYAADVSLAADLDRSSSVPRLLDGAYHNQSSS